MRRCSALRFAPRRAACSSSRPRARRLGSSPRHRRRPPRRRTTTRSTRSGARASTVRRRASLARPIVAMATTANGTGYWVVAADGGVFSFNAPFYGALAGWPLAQPVIGMTATPSGTGYWIVDRRRLGVPFGDAQALRHRCRTCTSTRRSSRSSPAPAARATGCTRPTAACSRSAPRASTARPAACVSNAPVVGMASTPSGKGYWLVAADGGIFSFGDAQLLRLHRRACA